MSLSVRDPNQTAEPLGPNGEKQGASQREILLLIFAPSSSLFASYRRFVRTPLATQQALNVNQRDEGLVAWLASRPDVKEQYDDAGATETWVGEVASGVGHNYMDSVEQVFAHLETRLGAL